MPNIKLFYSYNETRIHFAKPFDNFYTVFSGKRPTKPEPNQKYR